MSAWTGHVDCLLTVTQNSIVARRVAIDRTAAERNLVKEHPRILRSQNTLAKINIGLDVCCGGGHPRRGTKGRTTMNFRRTGSISLALAAFVAIGALMTDLQARPGPAQGPQGAEGRGARGAEAPGGAQGRGRGGDPNAGAPYTPAVGAKDLRAVLFNW